MKTGKAIRQVFKSMGIFVLCFTFLIIKPCSAQNLDSLNKKILAMESRLIDAENHNNDIEVRIEKFKDQHQTGMRLMVPAALIFLGEIYINKNTFKNDGALLYASSAVFAAGFIITFDSYRHLNRKNKTKRL